MFGHLKKFIKRTKTLQNFRWTVRHTPAPKVLFIVNGVDTTGAPMMTLQTIRALPDKYKIFTISMRDGNAAVIFAKYGKLFIMSRRILSKILDRVADKFDLCICETIETLDFASRLQKRVPTVLWLHESKFALQYLVNKPANDLKNVLCVSEYAKHILQPYFKNNIDVIHNCVEDVLADIKTYDKQSDVFNIALVGTQDKNKGFDIALNAIKKINMPNIKTYLIGQARPWGNEHLVPLCDENVIATGCIADQKEKYNLFAKMDLFVVPSYDESCSLVTLEAAMLGKPVIVSSNVGAKYMITNGVNGFVFKVGDQEELSETIKQILDKKRLLKIGQENRKAYLKYATYDVFKNRVNKYIGGVTCSER